MKTALIIGHQGQDGQLLWNHLSRLDYSLIGIGRNNVRSQGLNWAKPVDITDFEQVRDLITNLKPQEIYHFAAKHASSTDKQIEDLVFCKETFDINALSALNVLESIRLDSKTSKFFYASSSHIFDPVAAAPQDEQSALRPSNPYAASKIAAMNFCNLYRSKHNVFATTGILFSHESHLRKDTFLSKKLVLGAIKAKRGHKEKITVGSLSARNDWGFAEDFVEAMHRILSVNTPDDFVIASGQTHTVVEFAQQAFGQLGLNWQDYVVETPQILERESTFKWGNISKIKALTGWYPSTEFAEMIQRLLIDCGATQADFSTR